MLEDALTENIQDEMIDHEIIFDICTNHISNLKAAVQKIINTE